MAYKREVDTNRLEIVEEYSKSNEDLIEYIKEAGFTFIGNTMSCPFHGSDSTPSLRVNGNKWKCFGCGRGGGYLKFRHELELLDNSKMSYYDVAEKYAHEHSDLTALVGGTIYKSVEESFDEQWDKMISIATDESYKPKIVKTDSIDKLIRRVRKSDTETKMRLLSAIQEDIAYPIMESIVSGTDLTGKSLLDLANS